jgi:glycosyltransferase involved in cell wall biosynthesis
MNAATPDRAAPPRVSVILITRDEEQNLDACLAGVRWADEIVVVDCGSRDRTREIALQYTDRFHHRAWDGYSRQRAHALGLASHEWVFSLDADERVTPELADEVRRVVGSAVHDGYLVKRDNYFLGKLMVGGGWQHDYQMRLFRKSRARVTDRLVHESFVIDGEAGRLSNPLLHLTYASIFAGFRKTNEHTSLSAIECAASRKGSVGAVVLHPLSTFLRCYVSRKGYRDGAHGLVLSLLYAVSTMLLYMKIWEIKRQVRGKPPER